MHATTSSNEFTLRDFLVKNFSLNNVGQINREGIVHRLDRVTSGLVVCPLNSKSYNEFQIGFKDRKITKKYKAIVEGFLKSNSGEINLPLAHSKKNRKKREVNKNGRNSITLFETIEKTSKYTYLDLNLITGRNHQIRAHFEHLGNPVANDTLYGAKKISFIDSSTICLQSYYLSFTLNSENFTFEIVQPDYFTSLLSV